MMGIPAKEWDYLPSPVLMLCKTSSQEFLQMQSNTDEYQEEFSHNNRNTNIICVGDKILDAPEESGIE